MFLSSVALRAVTPRIVVVEAVVAAAEVAAVVVVVVVEAAAAIVVVEAAVVAADIAVAEAVEAAVVGKRSCRLYFAKSINQQAGEAITICPCQKYGSGVIAFSIPMVGLSFLAYNPLYSPEVLGKILYSIFEREE